MAPGPGGVGDTAGGVGDTAGGGGATYPQLGSLG